MRTWLGGASNWVSFSSQICHPSLVLAKVIDLSTTLLSGRQMQPAQDWLPIAIPQTYLMTTPSGEEADTVLVIAHLLFLHGLISAHFLASFFLSTRASEKPDQPGRASAH